MYSICSAYHWYIMLSGPSTPLERVARLGCREHNSPVPCQLSHLLGFFEYYFGPPAGIIMLLDQGVDGVTTADVQDTATEALSGALSKYGSTCDPEWKPILRRLVRIGAELHRLAHSPHPRLDPPETPLNQLVQWFHDALESESFFDQWLVILAEEAHNVEEYVRVESEIRARHSVQHYHRSNGPRFTPYQLHFSISPPSIRFKWWMDPLSPAAEVLEEFKNIGPLSFPESVDELEGYFWPCDLEWWDFSCRGGFGSFYFEDEPEYIAWRKLLDKRFQRREERKLAKYYKSLGYRGRREMPGAWRD